MHAATHVRHRVKSLSVPALTGAILLACGMSTPVWAANLMDVYQQAEQNDQTLQAAEQKRLATQQNVPIQRANLLPQLNGSGALNYTRTDIKSGGFVGAPDTIKGTSRELGLSLSQAVYNRADNLQLGIAHLQSDQANTDYAAAQQDLMLRTAEAYFGVLKANAQLQLSLANRSALKRQLEQAQKRYEVGLIAVTDVADAQAKYDKANADTITARNALANAQSALATITGMQPEQLADVRTELSTPKPKPADMSNWTKQAMDQNLSVQSAVIGTEIAQKSVDVNRAARMPTVNLNGQYGYNNTPNQFTGARSETLSGTIGLQLNVPIYTGGRINAKSRQAAFQYQQSQHQLDGLRRTVEQSTANDFRGVVTNISEIRAYRQAVESARTSLAATEAGYQVGTRTIVDVLNAELQVFSAMSSFLDARYNYIINSLRLKSDTGQLSVKDLQQVNAQLVEGKINPLIAPLMKSGKQSHKEQEKMIRRVVERAQKAIKDSDGK